MIRENSSRLSRRKLLAGLGFGVAAVGALAAPALQLSWTRKPGAKGSWWDRQFTSLANAGVDEWTRQIEMQGVDVVEPISAYGLFVVGTPAAVANLRNLPFVTWVGPFKPAYRIAPNLTGLMGLIRYVSIGIYPEHEVPRVKSTLAQLGATIVREAPPLKDYHDEYTRLIVEVNADDLPTLAKLPGVRWLHVSLGGLGRRDVAALVTSSVDFVGAILLVSAIVALGITRDQDACPGSLQVHQAADGALARVRLPGGMIAPHQLEALAHAADDLGSPEMELTSRGNIQIRGLTDPEKMADIIAGVGLLPSTTQERVRNIVASPLSGRAGGSVDIRDVVTELDDAIQAEPELAGLPGRFLFGVDDGRADICGLGADVVSIGEYRRARAAGIAPDRIVAAQVAVDELVPAADRSPGGEQVRHLGHAREVARRLLAAHGRDPAQGEQGAAQQRQAVRLGNHGHARSRRAAARRLGGDDGEERGDHARRFRGYSHPPVTRHQSWRHRLRLGASGSPSDDGPDEQRYSRADPQLSGTHQSNSRSRRHVARQCR